MIIDYYLITMHSRQRGMFDVKVFDADNVNHARKRAMSMEKGLILNVLVMYRKLD